MPAHRRAGTPSTRAAAALAAAWQYARSARAQGERRPGARCTVEPGLDGGAARARRAQQPAARGRRAGDDGDDAGAVGAALAPGHDDGADAYANAAGAGPGGVAVDLQTAAAHAARG